MRRGLIYLVFLLLAVLAINSCTNQSETQTYTGPVEIVTLGAETSLLTSAVWVAESKGYFQDEGLELIIKEFDSGRLSFLDMLEGGVDISTVAPTPIVFNSFDRQDFSVLATFVSSEDDVKVIVNKDKGISTAADLKGKKIGTPARTTGQFFLAAFLTFKGLSESDVETIDIKPSDLPNALHTGEVDGIVIWEPHAYNAQKLLGDKAIRLPSSDVYKETFNFMVMNDFAKENPKTLKRFLKAIIKATDFIKNNKEESQEIVAKRLYLDQEVMTILWEDFVFESSLSQSLILTLENEARWAIDNNLTSKKETPNYLKYIYTDALEEIDKNKITII